MKSSKAPFESQIVFHIGFHKTATSWFQRNLARLDGINLISDPQDICQALVFPDQLNFDKNKARELLEDLSKRGNSSGLPIYSAERLSGSPDSGGHDRLEIFHRIAACYPNAKIWMTVRNQKDIILSAYKQYVKMGGSLPIRQYLFSKPPIRQPGFKFEFYEFDAIARLYRDAFGPKNVHIAVFEEFKRNPQSFLLRLGDFLQVDLTGLADSLTKRENVSDRAGAIQAIRWLNGFRADPYIGHYPSVRIRGHSPMRKLLRKIPFREQKGSSALEIIVENAVGSRYAHSNMRLQEMIEPRLEDYGYLLPTSIMADSVGN